MNYIVNPLLIYLGDVLYNLGSFLVFIIGLFIVVIFLSGIFYAVNYGDKNADNKNNLKRIKVSIIIAFILGLILSFIPSKSTYYGMIASSYLTTDNLDVIGSKGKEVVDYLFEKIKEIDEDKNDNK